MTYEYDDINFDNNIDLKDDIDYDEISNEIHDGLDIEKLISSISRAREEVAFLKKLKDKRVAPIDEKINKLIENESKMKSFILSLMPTLFPKKNTIDFPGVGKISKRKNTGKWSVTDEEAFIKMIKEYKVYDDVMKIKATVDKKKVPSVVSKILTTASESDLKGIEFIEPDNDTSLVLKIYSDSPTIDVDDSENTEIGF